MHTQSGRWPPEALSDGAMGVTWGWGMQTCAGGAFPVELPVALKARAPSMPAWPSIRAGGPGSFLTYYAGGPVKSFFLGKGLSIPRQRSSTCATAVLESIAMGKSRGKKKKEPEYVPEDINAEEDAAALLLLLSEEGEDTEKEATSAPVETAVVAVVEAKEGKPQKSKGQKKREAKAKEEAAMIKAMEDEMAAAKVAKEAKAAQEPRNSHRTGTRSNNSSRGERSMESAGIVLYVEQTRRVLLLKNRKGHWDYPKGAVMAGESHIATAIREFSEETGLPRDMVSSISDPAEFEFSYNVRGRVKRVALYLAKVAEQPENYTLKCDSREIVGFEFVPVSALVSHMQWDEDKQLARDICSRLS